MTFTKKLIALLLVVMLSFGAVATMAACTKKDDTTDTSTTTAIPSDSDSDSETTTEEITSEIELTPEEAQAEIIAALMAMDAFETGTFSFKMLTKAFGEEMSGLTAITRGENGIYKCDTADGTVQKTWYDGEYIYIISYGENGGVEDAVKIAVTGEEAASFFSSVSGEEPDEDTLDSISKLLNFSSVKKKNNADGTVSYICNTAPASFIEMFELGELSELLGDGNFNITCDKYEYEIVVKDGAFVGLNVDIQIKMETVTMGITTTVPMSIEAEMSIDPTQSTIPAIDDVEFTEVSFEDYYA